MKTILILIFSSIFLMSCKQSITLISAEKQTVVPGRPNIEKYHNYEIKFNITESKSVTVDSVRVFEDEKSYLSKFRVQKVGAASFSSSINESGDYVLQAPINRQNIISSKTESAKQNKVIVFYTENNASNKMEINEFTLKTVPKR